MPSIMKTGARACRRSRGFYGLPTFSLGTSHPDSNVLEILWLGSFLFMETYEELYLDLAAEHRRKADASTDQRERETLLKLVNAFEVAAESIRRYPEAA